MYKKTGFIFGLLILSVSTNASIITFDASSAGAIFDESVGLVHFTVLRQGSSLGSVSVEWASSNGTASAPADYTAGSGSITWSDNDAANKTITLAVTDDNLFDPDESFFVSIFNPSSGAILGDITFAEVQIVDNDAISNLFFDPASLNIFVDGAVGTASLTVLRAGSSGGPVSVDFATSNGTASATEDYTAVSGSLFWSDNDTSPKTFQIPILSNSLFEADENFFVSLFNPIGVVNVDDNITAQINILGNPAAVPEPSMFVLFGTGFILLLIRRRRSV